MDIDSEIFICFKCKHFLPVEGGCKAFPDGIPDDITTEHSKPLPEQGNDIVFEPIEN